MKILGGLCSLTWTNPRLSSVGEKKKKEKNQKLNLNEIDSIEHHLVSKEGLRELFHVHSHPSFSDPCSHFKNNQQTKY
jgi:hypothetical protein